MRIALLILMALLVAPLGAQDWALLEPGMPVAGKPGERVLVRLKGPSGREPYLKVGGQSKIYRLLESSPGLYQGEVFTPWNGSGSLLLVEPESDLQQRLGKLTGDSQEWSLEAPTELVTRQGPHPDYDRLTPLYSGQGVTIDGKRGGWYRCRESGTWVDARRFPEISASALPPNRLKRVVVSDLPNGDALLQLHLERCPEVQVRETGNTLQVALYDTYQTNFDVKRPTEVAPFLGPVVLTPQATPRAVLLEVSSPQLAGYQLQADSSSGTLRLRVRKPLVKKLEGLHITVDAGHGGPKDRGTVGHRGLQEKELNLRVAKALAAKLRALGARVTMTRTTDTDVATRDKRDTGELQARIDVSKEAGSQLFLSVHHNARPKIAEGKVYHGTDIYWYQPHSQTLAKALADPIADAIGEPQRSFRWRSFYVIRQTHAPAVLMEFQYLSNPQLEFSVLDQPDYPEKAAQGVVDGLLKYLTSL